MARKEVKRIDSRGGEYIDRGIERCIDYDEFDPASREIASEIHRLRMNMLVHSCMYYQLNANTITDAQFDRMAQRLAALQQKHPIISKRVPNAEFFKDWDGFTGYHLPLDDSKLIEKSIYIRDISRNIYDK